MRSPLGLFLISSSLAALLLAAGPAPSASAQYLGTPSGPRLYQQTQPRYATPGPAPLAPRRGYRTSPGPPRPRGTYARPGILPYRIPTYRGR